MASTRDLINFHLLLRKSAFEKVAAGFTFPNPAQIEEGLRNIRGIAPHMVAGLVGGMTARPGDEAASIFANMAASAALKNPYYGMAPGLALNLYRHLNEPNQGNPHAAPHYFG